MSVRSGYIAKKVDAVGQILITPIVACAAALLDGDSISEVLLDPGTLFFAGLFGVGGWQIISCLASVVLTPKDRYMHSRRVYEKLLILVMVFGGFAWISSGKGDAEFPLYYAMIMLFTGPAMAVFYFIITVMELGRMDRFFARVASDNTDDLNAP